MALQLKLQALRYPEDCDLNNELHLKRVVTWLEDTCIRYYPIEERESLRKFNEEWTTHFAKYLEALNCPYPATQPALATDWLIGYAISLEYRDNKDVYNSVAAACRSPPTTPAAKDATNYDSPEFKQAVNTLADLLQIPRHEDPKRVLNAALRIIQKKFTPEALEAAQKDKSGKSGPAMLEDASQQLPLGFDTGDPVVNKAATVLRLLYVDDLRDLQTHINELIATIQGYTANPKTDSSLGRVGR